MGEQAEAAGADLSREILAAARSLAALLRGTPAVERLRQARQAVLEREAARIMLRDLTARQQRLLQRRAAGETIDPGEWEQFQELARVVAYNPYVRELLEAEQAVAALLAAVLAELEQGLQLPQLDLPQGQGPTEAPPERPATAGPQGVPQPGPTATRSRLWVPGQPLPRPPGL